MDNFEQLQRTFYENALELYYLENGGNSLDYEEWLKKPASVGLVEHFFNDGNSLGSARKWKQFIQLAEAPTPANFLQFVRRDGNVPQTSLCMDSNKNGHSANLSRNVSCNIKDSWAEKIKSKINVHNSEKTCGENVGGKRKARKCCAQNCSSDGQTLFAFPSMFKNVKSKFILNHENVMRFKQWVKLAGNKNLLSYKAQGLCTNAFLCSDHFSPEQFLSNDQLILNATPNLFKCIPLTENDVDKYFMKYLLFTQHSIGGIDLIEQ